MRSYIENPEGPYYSTKSRYCNTPPRVQALGSEEEEEVEEEEHLELVMCYVESGRSGREPDTPIPDPDSDS